tara:strand:- start:38 stop:157 length:120 start_codon:yes stop_codon:yes gene_type:complete
MNLRKLKLNYHLMESEKNIATKHLLTEKDTTGRDSKDYV